MQTIKARKRLTLTVLLAAGLGACGTSSAPDNNATAGGATPSASDFSGRQHTCSGSECEDGRFKSLGSEPFIRYSTDSDGDDQVSTMEMMVEETEEKCVTDDEGDLRCKPAGGSIALLPNNSFIYFNALEGTENVEASIVAEFGYVSVNDQTRILSLGGAGPEDSPKWQRPAPLRGGGNLDGNESTTLLPPGIIDDSGNTAANDAALFCADLIQLADGRIMATGGTDYFTEPSLSGSEDRLRTVFPALEDATLLSDALGAIDGEVPLPPVGAISVPDDLGVVELEGVKNARIFNGETGQWEQTGSMSQGRWYPTMVTLPNGDVSVFSGVTKLLKPVYLGDVEDPGPNNLTNLLRSGDNVRIAERYDLDTGEWSDFGKVETGGVGFNSSERPLPLFPRMHLLPNGHVYYSAGGQAFNPFGQSYNQAQWNFVATFNPDARDGEGEWATLGYAGFPLHLNRVGLENITDLVTPTNPEPAQDLVETLQGLAGGVVNTPEQLMNLAGIADPSLVNRVVGSGFRGSTFSIMMPLEPNENGEYTKTEFLTAGGVLGGVAATSPGLYVGTPFSRVDTVTIDPETPDDPSSMAYQSRVTGGFNRPRWYPSGVLLPDGSVMAFNGADADEVVLPGLARPNKMAERFDPETEQWEDMTTSLNARTYHNTALLMPDGRVLVGGHAPINTGYLNSLDLSQLPLPERAQFSPNDGRDPTFEVYEPPYVFRDRPVINSAPGTLSHGDRFTIQTPDAQMVETVVLIRRTTTTHLVDGDQRAVELPFNTQGNQLNVQLTDNPAVAPGGHYMLFINTRDDDGMVLPSVSAPVRVERPEI